MEEGPRPACTFLIPLVRDSDRRLHPPVVWRLLQDALLRTFGALTGPEPVLYYRSPEAVRGTWRPEEGKTAKTLLDTCDALPEAERPEVAREILRRTALAEPGPLEDPDLVALGDEVFRDLEHAEEPR